MKNIVRFWGLMAVIAAGTILTAVGFITGIIWLALTGAVLAICGFISMIVSILRDKDMLDVNNADLNRAFKPGFLPRLWLLGAGLVLDSIAIGTGFLPAAVVGLVFTLLGISLLLRLFLIRG